jgi:hypothetical protein
VRQRLCAKTVALDPIVSNLQPVGNPARPSPKVSPLEDVARDEKNCIQISESFPKERKRLRSSKKTIFYFTVSIKER